MKIKNRPSRIFNAVVFKALALGASFLNVIIAGLVLPGETALLYLSMLSTVQISIPFAGIGISQRLVQLDQKGVAEQRVWPWFLLSTSIGLAILALQFRSAGFDLGLPLFLLCSIFMGHIATSEYLRAGQARQSGFHVYNIALVVVALSIFFQKEVGYIAVAVATFSAAFFVYRERATLFGRRSTFLRPRGTDISTAFRVLCINQYYNVLVVSLTIIAPSPELFAVVLVWRFNIFFNWQTFYWLRFGHKDLGAGPTASQRKENLKVTGLNVAACASACVVALVALNTDVLAGLRDTAFNDAFFLLLIIYAVTRTAINLIFPFELFSVYGATSAEDRKFFALAFVTFAAICSVMLLEFSSVVILLTVECGALIWRLYCARWTN